MSSKAIRHYASPYYDPVKAHEYYEKTKQLKGRSSTASLNEEGKNAAKYVKEQLTAERKQKTEQSKASMQSKIDNLNNMLSGLTSKQKKALRPKIKAQIAQLRDEFKIERDRIKAVYDEMYLTELDKMRSEAAFLKPVKKRK